MDIIHSSSFGFPPDHPINLTNAELAQRLLELLEVAAIPEAHIKIVKEAAQRFIDMGD
ncbi:hypothetical protein LZT27_14585 [Aeromonas veronii]|uniref:hypothetical protein n=1 Tax=Aeromonas veronii TaxID=654 RepID=UPI002363641B|nr:hypothetical protein [Aeromonas veronii]MDD1845817.1 hypothetical protein [Aeromonas veronii]